MMKNFKRVTAGCFTLALSGGLLVPSLANATTASGAAIINIDQAALGTIPGAWYLEDYMDSSYNSTKLNGAVIPDPHPGNGPLTQAEANGLQFSINGASISSGIPERILQPTNWDSVSNPTGQIGLSGVLRIRATGVNGYLNFQDLSLKYDAAKVNQGGFGESGWFLTANEPNFPLGFGVHPAIDLVNVTQSDVNGQLSLTGDLIFGNEDWSNLLFNFPAGPGARNAVFGNISISAVPVPAAVWLFGSALLGLTGFKRRTSNVLSA